MALRERIVILFDVTCGVVTYGVDVTMPGSGMETRSLVCASAPRALNCSNRDVTGANERILHSRKTAVCVECCKLDLYLRWRGQVNVCNGAALG